MNDLAAELAAERGARTAAERRNEILERFLSVLAHELQTPLATLLLWARLLRDHELAPELHAQALDAIQDSAVTQSRLVDDLLAVARVLGGRLRLSRSQVALAPVLADAIDRVRPAATARGITIAHDGDVALGTVEGDATRLRQAFEALLAHAVAACDPEGRVAVIPQRAGGAITIAVEHGGRGFAPDRAAQLFDPAIALREPADGPRFALVIARELIAIHGGALTAASPADARGTTFTITLPEASAPAPSPAPRPHALANLNILVVDNDPRVRDALAHLLARAGAIVDTAGSAAEARAAIDRTPFDVAICDISMPGEDGYELLDGLRRSGWKVPAIALTAYAGDELARRSRDVGFAAHLTKPIAFDQLRATIAKIVARADET